MSSTNAQEEEQRVPAVNDEESVGKATEDFGGYDLDDEKSGTGN